MRVLFVESAAVSFRQYVTAFVEAGVQADAAPDARTALWLLAKGDYRVVVLSLTGELLWEVVSAALWSRPPARVIALAEGPVDPALRRKAYGAGVWELGELPRHVSRGAEPIPSLVPAVRRALREAAPVALLVDDCAEVVAGISSTIAEEGFRIERASSREEAVSMMTTADYALLITETHGPADGFAVMREAARLQPGVPVIAFTATVDDETLLRSIELGARACVWKLAEPEEIAREILAVMRSGREQGSSRT